jgi:hypothetical protein
MCLVQLTGSENISHNRFVKRYIMRYDSFQQYDSSRSMGK